MVAPGLPKHPVRLLLWDVWAATLWQLPSGLLNAALEGELSPSSLRPTRVMRARQCLVSSALAAPAAPSPSAAARPPAGPALPAAHVALRPGCIFHILPHSESCTPLLPKPVPVPGCASRQGWLQWPCMAPCKVRAPSCVCLLQGTLPCLRDELPTLGPKSIAGMLLPCSGEASVMEVLHPMESTHLCTLCPKHPREGVCILCHHFPAPGTASLTCCCLLSQLTVVLGSFKECSSAASNLTLLAASLARPQPLLISMCTVPCPHPDM